MYFKQETSVVFTLFWKSNLLLQKLFLSFYCVTHQTYCAIPLFNVTTVAVLIQRTIDSLGDALEEANVKSALTV